MKTYYLEIYGITEDTYKILIETLKSINKDLEYNGGEE